MTKSTHGARTSPESSSPHRACSTRFRSRAWIPRIKPRHISWPAAVMERRKGPMKPGPSGDVTAFALVNGRLAGTYGTTLSLSSGRPTAILIEDGRVVQLADDDTVRGLLGRRGRAIDVGGAVVAPGLVDAHMHAFDCALASLRVSCLPPAVDSLTGLR